MLQTLKNKALVLAVPASLLLSGVAMAQDANSPATVSLDTLVSTAGLRTAITNQVIEWVSIGFGLGASLLVLWLGWRLLRRFIH